MTILRKTTLVLVVGASALSGCLLDSASDRDGGPLAIDGYVRDVMGSPIKGVTMKAYLGSTSTLSPVVSCSTFTNARGYYRIPFNASLQSLVIKPRKGLCRFSPPEISYYDPQGPLHNENFTAYCGSMHRIAGRVRRDTGEALIGVAIMVREVSNLWNTTVFTSQDGSYEVTRLVPGYTYTLTPSFAAHRFTPPARTYESLDQDFTEQDFIASEMF